MFKVQYRFVVYQIIAGVSTPAIAVGYGNPPAALSTPAVITSLNTAITQGMAFNRRFQAAGIDSRLEVYGQVFDDGVNTPATPVRAMTAGEMAEQQYAGIDTPDHGLKQRLSLANRSATGSGEALSGDFPNEEPV